MTSLTAIKDAVSRLTLGYDYPAGQNNGNLASQSIADGTGSWQQTYTYDNFNRLTHAAEAGSWSETSSYDRWGNRWVSASNFPLNLATPTAGSQFNTATNRLQQESSGQPLPPNAYDAQGNLTNHPWIGQMSYDGEGKIWRHIKGGTTVEFTYDGEGRRVKKRVGTAPPTIYVYDATGQLTADYGTADGTPGCSTCYITADHLGSTRLTTGATGAPAGRLDYFPFGETIPGGASFGNRPSPTGPRQKFTGKERDQETGLDYFLARYYSSAQGRFTSTDEFPGGIVDPFTGQQIGRPGPLPYADITDPQTLNKYAYVRNNPLRYTDPDGHVIDALADAAFILYDLYKIGREGATKTNVAALGADVAGALIPGVTGLGAAVRAERAVEAGVQGTRLLREGVALGREITSIEGKISRQMKHLDAEHISAAARELKGEVVKINPRDGKAFDHVTEVREAAQGLQNQANKIKSILGTGDLTKKARGALENSLRQANKKLEELKKAGVI